LAEIFADDNIPIKLESFNKVISLISISEYTVLKSDNRMIIYG